MNLIRVAPNIVLMDERFGSFSHEIVPMLLRFVDESLSLAIGVEPFSSRLVIVSHTDSVPMCVSRGQSHGILLSTEGNYWCQWVYQFAHEYCHHLIDGPMTGDTTGLLWFEEVLCHTASLYCLSEIDIGRVPRKRTIPPSHQLLVAHLSRYLPSVHSYITNCHQGKVHTPQEIRRFVAEGLLAIRQDDYPRSMYNYTAASILPLFQYNPSLWKIVRYIGNSRMYVSADALFALLSTVADTTWGDSLQQLRSFFIGF